MPLRRFVATLVAACLAWAAVVPVCTPTPRDNIAGIVASTDGLPGAHAVERQRTDPPRGAASEGYGVAPRRPAAYIVGSIAGLLNRSAAGVRAGELLAFPYDATAPPTTLVS